MGTVVACETAALDDWQFSEEDELIAPGGRQVAEWLYQALGNVSQPVSPPANHGNYGWSFEVLLGGQRYWLLIASGPTEATMYVWVEQWWLWRILGRADRRRELLDAIAGLLTDDARFENVRLETPPRK